uniref:Uncharacterized protein n=1 Tax=Rhizophora mucronata TaxID=61149 RepID=A0A2P2NR07_RHIMU
MLILHRFFCEHRIIFIVHVIYHCKGVRFSVAFKESTIFNSSSYKLLSFPLFHTHLIFRAFF